MSRLRKEWTGVLSIGALACAVGCTPTYDWREVRPDGAALVAMFPCRPRHHARTADLAGTPLPMRLHVCSSGQETLSLAVLQVGEPTQVAVTLLALRAAAVANFSASQIRSSHLQVPGMTPNPNAASLSMHGVSAQGVPIQATAAFFAKGLRVYQATVFGEQIDPEVSQTFFAGLKLQ